MVGYLDNAASTPARPEVVEAMLPYLRDLHANPSGAHRLARDVQRALDDARETMADVLGASPGDVVFTSGGTESDNLAVLGVHDRCGGVAVCSAIEHHAVLDPVRSRQGRTVAVDGRGRIDLDALVDALDERVTIVSVMLVNNEVGTVQPLDDVAELVRRHAPGAVLHTDAVQATTWLDVGSAAAPADLVSVSAHKFGGPKGSGALVVRPRVALAARQIGGGQERERRSGTPNVAGIVGMAVAARLAADEREATVRRVTRLRDRLADGLLQAVPDLVETGAPVTGATADDERQAPVDRSGRVPGIVHVCVPGVESEALLYLLERDGVYASAGASCASGAMQPSHVLSAMGVARELARGSLRLSLGHSSCDADVDAALAAVPEAVEHLRRFAVPDSTPVGPGPQAVRP